MQLLNSTFAVVFLGGVHSTSDPTLLSERAVLILQSLPNNITKTEFARIADDIKLLGDICQLYQDAELHMQVPILSLYESDRTRVKIPMTEGKGKWSLRRPGIHMVRHPF